VESVGGPSVQTATPRTLSRVAGLAVIGKGDPRTKAFDDPIYKEGEAHGESVSSGESSSPV
jgi:hypothetical protein